MTVSFQQLMRVIPMWFSKNFLSVSIGGLWKLKEKRMQRSGTEAIRTQIQLSKPKREIAYITNSQNTKRTYGQPSEQLFPKRWPLSNPNRATNNMNTLKVKRHRYPDTKNRQQNHNKTTALERPVMNYWLGGLILVLRA